jgi:hypothetical protein
MTAGGDKLYYEAVRKKLAANGCSANAALLIEVALRIENALWDVGAKHATCIVGLDATHPGVLFARVFCNRPLSQSALLQARNRGESILPLGVVLSINPMLRVPPERAELSPGTRRRTRPSKGKRT